MSRRERVKSAGTPRRARPFLLINCSEKEALELRILPNIR
jgi:hypothetical protein